MKKFSARLHVIPARDARTGAVIRRGPSKSVAGIGGLHDFRDVKFEALAAPS